MESLRSDGNMGGGQFGGNLSAALSNLGLPPVDGPSSAVAQRKRANRGTRLSDIIKVSAAVWNGRFCRIHKMTPGSGHPAKLKPLWFRLPLISSQWPTVLTVAVRS